MAAGEIDQPDLELRPAELGESLPAETARGRRRVGIRQDEQGAEAPLAATYGRRDGGPLGAQGQAEAPILDIGPREQLAVLGAQGRADPKPAVGGVGASTRSARRDEERFPVHDLAK